MTHEEFLLATQLISDEGPGRVVRKQEARLDEQDAESRKQLGVV